MPAPHRQSPAGSGANAQVSGAPPGGTGDRRRETTRRAGAGLRTSEAGLLSGPPANSCSVLAKLRDPCEPRSSQLLSVEHRVAEFNGQVSVKSCEAHA